MKSFIVIACMGLFFNSSAQEANSTTLHHELYFNLYSGYIGSTHYFSTSNYGGKFFDNPYRQHFFTGLQYKYFIKEKHGIRSLVNYKKTIIDESFFSGATFSEFGKSNAIILSLGYEYMFTTGKIRPYVFADAEYQNITERGRVEIVDIITPYYYSRRYNDRTNQYGFLAGAGIKYNVGKNIFASLESAFGGSLFYTHDINVKNRDSKGRHLVLYPARMLSLGYSF